MNNQPELFEVETVLSPRAKWIKEHRIKTLEIDGRWRATTPGNVSYGETEEDAIADLMQKTGIPPMKREW